MGRVLSIALLLSFLASFSVHARGEKREGEPLRDWTPRDSVALRYFADETGSMDEAGSMPAISPDGLHFFFVSFHGDLSCDCNEYELSVFASEDVRQSLARVDSDQQPPPLPLRTLVRRSLPQKNVAILNPRWERDGESITFLGPVDDSGARQLYLFNIRSGAVTTLTNITDALRTIYREGDTIISEVEVPDAAPALVYPVHSVTRTELQDAFFQATTPRKVSKTLVSYRGRPPWEIKTTTVDFRFSPSFSSDGARVIAIRTPKVLPPSWAGYEQVSGLSKNESAEPANFPRFMVIDAEHGQEAPVFDAPAGVATAVGVAAARRCCLEALWAQDQKHVVLVNTALPLASGPNPERARMAYVVGYNVDSGKWAAIEPVESRDRAGSLCLVTQVGWLKPGTELLITHETDGKPTAGRLYMLRGDRWVGHMVAAGVRIPKRDAPRDHTLPGGVSVRLRQSANEPPVMMASDGHRELPLTPPDPALKGVWMARSEPFQWREPSGEMMTGGLRLPRGCALSGSADGAGEHGCKNLPLVIQVYYYEPDLFKPDGPFLHAFAAQTLAARGMAVLTMSGPNGDRPHVSRTPPEELDEYVQRINSAVDALSDRGLIDRARTGLIGFSRTGFEAYYAITHPGERPPAAAVIDDAFPGTYAYYLFMEGLFEDQAGYEGMYGGPFWQNKANWLEHENSFNVDRVRTPALFTVHGDALPYAVETIGAFALNHRPLEYLNFPNGGHVLTRVRQRLASLEASVDWMSFWLQGKAPADVERASRWAEMKTAWEKTAKEEAGPNRTQSAR